ncbi:NADH dehydrogenase (ubiquinone) B14 subunit [Lycorma delicatula]|uniref:NADH dehydrogenase (ubiquinone) B14 subunit n=1 Tax=Lycorma delicatula TaxID=130591 RepID=UPI003F51231C
MAASNVSRAVVKRQVKPLLSLDRQEARKRVINLYRAWYRQIPYIVQDFDIPKSIEQCREKLRSEFEKNRHLTDIRVIDMKVVKGQIDLQECVHIWKQSCHIMQFWKDTVEPKPKDFLSKFISGAE